MEAIEFFVENKTYFTIVHVLSVVVGMGSAIISDILFNFYSKDKKLDTTEKRSLELLSNTVWISLIGIILSGIAIFLSNPDGYLASAKFLTKMSIMGVLLINGLFLSFVISPHFNDKGLLKFKNKRCIRQLAFVGGAISISSWFIICILGVLKNIQLSVPRAMLLYSCFIVVAIGIALFVEKKVFSNN